MLGNKYFISLQPSFLNITNHNKNFFSKVKSDLFHSVGALINLPKNFMSPYRGQYSVAIINVCGSYDDNELLMSDKKGGLKPANQKVFFAELNSTNDIESVINNFLEEKNTNTLSSGFFESPENFKGFTYHSNQEKISKLSSDYKNFKNYRLDEIADIHSVPQGKEFKDYENSVYIPNVGKSSCHNSIKKLTLKHHNYFQCRIDPKIASNEFVENYLNSTIGVLNRESQVSGGVIKFISKKNISLLEVLVPEHKIQVNINDLQSRLRFIKDQINTFEENIILNPLSDKDTKRQLDKVADIFGTLSDSEKIKVIAEDGETRVSEFKETYSLCLNSNQKAQSLIVSSLKTIAAFLNTDGGDLLIGVSDSGEIKGIENELEKFDKNSTDNFLKRFRNNLVKYFGKGIYPLVDQKIVKVDGKTIFHVSCMATGKPVFMEEDKYFVRTNPATDMLTGQKLLDYIENRKKLFVSISQE